MKSLQQIILSLVIALSFIACSDTKKKPAETAKSPEQENKCPPCDPKPTVDPSKDGKGADPAKTPTGPTQPEAPTQQPGPGTQTPPKQGSNDPATPGGQPTPAPATDPAAPGPNTPPPASATPTLEGACTMVSQIWTYELKTEKSKEFLEVEFAFNSDEKLEATDTLQRLFKDETKKPKLILELEDPKAPHQGYFGQWKVAKVAIMDRGQEHSSTFNSYQKELTKADQSKDKLEYNISGPKLFFTPVPKPLLFISVPLKHEGEKAFQYCVLVNIFAAENNKLTITPVGTTVMPKEPPVPTKLEDLDPALLKILAPLLKP